METKGLKMLRNVETRWISMRSPAQQIMSEYKTLLVKIGLNMSRVGGSKPNATASTNYDYLSDIEVLLSLSCFIPMLNVVHCLIKLSQDRDVFICDFLYFVKLCQVDLARMFRDDSIAFLHLSSNSTKSSFHCPPPKFQWNGSTCLSMTVLHFSCSISGAHLCLPIATIS